MQRSKVIVIIVLCLLAAFLTYRQVEKQKGGGAAEEVSGKMTVPGKGEQSSDIKEQVQAGEGQGGQEGEAEESEAEVDEGGEEVESQEDEDDLKVALNFKDVEMRNVVEKLASWTGKVVIPTDEAMGQKLTIYSPVELSRSQALAMIYAALRTKGFIADHTEDTIFLRPISEVRTGSIPTIGSDDPLSRIEDKTLVVEKYFRLKNYSPSDLAEIITPLVSDFGHVTAIEDTSQIAVIDSVENLERIKRIIDQLDVVESAQTIERTFEINYGDPVEICEILNVIVRERLRRTERTGRGRDRGKPDEEEMATTVIIEASKSPYKLIPMPKQRWIIARADSETMEEIAKWIEKLDKPEQSKSEQTIVQVRYVDVREVVDIVRKTLQEIPGTEFKTGVIVEALPQSRQIVIFGSEENRKMVEALIAEIDLPSTDIFEQRTFKLKHADPDKLKENIEELYEDSNAKIPWYRRRWRENTEDTVRVISYPATSQITVIASAKNMEKIAQQIKEEWDKPVDISRDQYRIISLKNSDPVKMAELLTKLFSEELSSGRSPWSYIFNRRDEEEAKKKIVGSLYGTLTFEAVPDTKKLIVISNLPEAYDIVEQLVKELDSQDTAEVPKVITLQYADPEDLSDQLNAILNEPGTLSTIRRSKRGLSIPSSDSDGTSSKKIDEDDDGDSANIITPWWDKSRRRDDEMPASNLIGKVRFIPVARSKAILVLAPPEYMVELEAMINTLDQPGKQVMIKAVIVEMNHDDLTSLGVKLSSNPSSFGTLGENAMQVVNTFTNLEQFGSITLESSLSVNVLVDLLVQKANAKILNQPTLWTKDNEEAVFFKGRQVPFVESDQTDTTGASIKTSVDYRDVGVTLRIRPNITPEKAVDININLEISQVEDQLVNGQIATNKLDTTTHLIVDNGQTLMLGGILFQTESRINTKVPLLGDIPVVGGVFNHNKDTLTNNELLIFLTPYVIDEQTNPSEMEQVKGPVGRMREVIERLDSLFENKIYLPGYVSPEDSDSDQGVELPAERID